MHLADSEEPLGKTSASGGKTGKFLPQPGNSCRTGGRKAPETPNQREAAMSLTATTSRTSSTTTTSSSLSQTLFSNTPSYSFAQDSRGRPLIATVADLNAATKASDKLTIAAQVAESVRMQADAAIRTGKANRIADMTAQAKQVIDAVNSVVNGLKSGTPSASGADPALKSYQGKISSVLNSLSSSLPSLKALTSRASNTVAAAATTSLKSVDGTAAGVAKLAGLTWTSPFAPPKTATAKTAAAGAGKTTATTGTSLAAILNANTAPAVGSLLDFTA
ncbi:MAG: hypothetical protein WCJ64_10080 [Rhodospirillaceae bacterium]